MGARILPITRETSHVIHDLTEQYGMSPDQLVRFMIKQVYNIEVPPEQLKETVKKIWEKADKRGYVDRSDLDAGYGVQFYKGDQPIK